MIRNVVLRTQIGNAGGWIVFDNIKYKGKNWMITDQGKCMEVKPFQVEKIKCLNTRVTPIEPMPFSYDDTGDPNDYENNNQKIKVALIKHHHQVMTEGFQNPNMGSAVLFEFEDLSVKSIKEYKSISFTRSALNKASGMNYRQKVDAFYFYAKPNESPLGRDGKLLPHRDISIKLMDLSSGILLRKSIYKDGKTLIEHFIEDYKDGDATYVLRITIIKALTLGLLKREGMAILFGETVLGSNIDEVMVWFNNHTEKKNYLIREVSQKDLLDIDDIDASISEEKPEETLKKKSEDSEIRDEAKKYGIIGYAVGKTENMIPKIEAAKKQWEEAIKLGVEFVDRMNPDRVAELIKDAKKKAKELV